MSDEPIDPTEIETESFFNPPKKKKKTLMDPHGLGITTRELRLLANYPDVLAGKKTLTQVTREAGFGLNTKNPATIGQAKLTQITKKLSKNDILLDALSLNGASLEDAAKKLAEMLHATTMIKCTPHAGNIEGLKTVPDNRVQKDTAIFLVNAYGAMPEKKVISETRTYEEKVTIVKQIKDNPELAMEIARRLTGRTEEKSE